MITKFNKLIANKVVWIGFTFLIVVAFAFMGLSGAGDDRDRDQSMGTLFGDPISFDEYSAARRLAYLGFILSMNEQVDEEELQDATWRRLATLRRAREMGIQTTDREIVQAIRNFPDFQHEGQFHPQIYDQFLNQYLGAMGFRPSEFENFVRQELAIQKIQRMIVESVLLSQTELDRAISTLGDEFTVQYSFISREALGEGLAATEEDARVFFEENTEAFRIPAQVRVNFVRFPVREFMQIVEVSEEQALDYYDRNIDDFIVETEQEEDLDDEDADLFDLQITEPFEEVQEEIIERLTIEKAANEAAHEATDFVISLVPDRHGNAPSFDEAAENFGVEIQTTDPFSENEIPEGIDAGLAFSRAAFGLLPNPEHYFSDAVRGQDYIYVLALEEQIPSRLPEFEEVLEEALAAAQSEKEANALEELANSFRDLLEETLAAGDSFEDAAEAFLLSVSDPITFTAAEGPQELPYARQLVQAVIAYNAGEIPAPIFVGHGFIVAHIQEREPADPMLYAEFQPRIISALSGERGMILFRDWEDQLLAEANFTPRHADEFRDWDDESAEEDLDLQ